MENLFLRFPGGKKKALTLSYDDGKEQDIRLVSIMRRNGLKGTFNLNGGGLFEESRKDRRRTLTIREAKELYPENGGGGSQPDASPPGIASYGPLPV